MKRHTSNRLVALVLLALLATAPALAFTGSTGTTLSGQRDGRGVRFEVAIHAGDRVGTAIVAFETSPIEMLSPAWMTSDRRSRSHGLAERLHRAVVLVRALGKATWAVLKQQLGRHDPDTDGTTKEEDADADRRRSA
jgi:hypothetical protein